MTSGRVFAAEVAEFSTTVITELAASTERVEVGAAMTAAGLEGAAVGAEPTILPASYASRS